MIKTLYSQGYVNWDTQPAGGSLLRRRPHSCVNNGHCLWHPGPGDVCVLWLVHFGISQDYSGWFCFLLEKINSFAIDFIANFLSKLLILKKPHRTQQNCPSCLSNVFEELVLVPLYRGTFWVRFNYIFWVNSRAIKAKPLGRSLLMDQCWWLNQNVFWDRLWKTGASDKRNLMSVSQPGATTGWSESSLPEASWRSLMVVSVLICRCGPSSVQNKIKNKEGETETSKGKKRKGKKKKRKRKRKRAANQQMLRKEK